MKNKTQRVRLKPFGFDVRYFFANDENDHADLLRFLKKYDTPLTNPQVERQLRGVEQGRVNGGLTFFNGERLMLVVVTLQDSAAEFWSTVVHENRHVVDMLCEKLNIEDDETSAYLEGYLMKRLFEKWEM